MKPEALIIIKDLRRQAARITQMADDLEQLYAADLRQEEVLHAEQSEAALKLWNQFAAAPASTKQVLAKSPSSAPRTPQLDALTRNERAREFILAQPHGNYSAKDLIVRLDECGITGFLGNTKLHHLLERMAKAKEIGRDGRKYVIRTQDEGFTLTDKAQVKEVKLANTGTEATIEPPKGGKQAAPEPPKPVAIGEQNRPKPAFDPFSDRVVGLMASLAPTFNNLEIIALVGTQNAPTCIRAWMDRKWIKTVKANVDRFERGERFPK